MTILISNLPQGANEEYLQELFEEYGPVESVLLPRDFRTNQVCGFAFIEIPKDFAEAAIAELDGSSWMGNRLQVSEAGFSSWHDDLDLAVDLAAN